MSITVFYAVCILSIDFLIYFFFKLVYAGKKDRVVRRLPPEYYDDDSWACHESESSTAPLVPTRKKRLPRAMKVLSMPALKLEIPGTTARQGQLDDAVTPRNSAELLAHRRIVSLFAHARPSRKAN